MENSDKIVVLITVLIAGILTWKMVFDFYKVRLHKIFAHVIAVATSSFMFLSSMLLFVPKNYQRGATAEVEFSLMSFITVVVMLLAIYLLFKYLPNRNSDKTVETTKKPSKKSAKKAAKKNQ